VTFGFFGEGGYWVPVRDGDVRALGLYRRHYSARRYRAGRRNTKIAGPGEHMALMTASCDALFVWKKYRSLDGQQGICCSVFRNEGNVLSSELIREACAHAWRRWPGERLYTYVNPRKVRSTNPGYCFLQAGWRKCGRTKGGLVILECLPEVEETPRREA